MKKVIKNTNNKFLTKLGNAINSYESSLSNFNKIKNQKQYNKFLESIMIFKNYQKDFGGKLTINDSYSIFNGSISFSSPVLTFTLITKELSKIISYCSAITIDSDKFGIVHLELVFPDIYHKQ